MFPVEEVMNAVELKALVPSAEVISEEEAYAAFHCVPLAVRGIKYPEVKAVAPVVLVYVSPVAVFVKRPQMVDEESPPLAASVSSPFAL